MRFFNRSARMLGEVIVASALFNGALILTLISAILIAIPLIAMAQVGNRNFFEPLITADPNPGNTLDIIPQWTRSSTVRSSPSPFRWRRNCCPISASNLATLERPDVREKLPLR